MSVDSLIFWLFVAAWIVVGAILFFVLLPRMVGEVQKIIRHVVRLVEGSALPLQIAKAQADVDRIEAAAARVPALRNRAEAALSQIRTTPLVPPELRRLITRFQVEIAQFRRESGRISN